MDRSLVQARIARKVLFYEQEPRTSALEPWLLITNGVRGKASHSVLNVHKILHFHSTHHPPRIELAHECWLGASQERLERDRRNGQLEIHLRAVHSGFEVHELGWLDGTRGQSAWRPCPSGAFYGQEQQLSSRLGTALPSLESQNFAIPGVCLPALRRAVQSIPRIKRDPMRLCACSVWMTPAVM